MITLTLLVVLLVVSSLWFLITNGLTILMLLDVGLAFLAFYGIYKLATRKSKRK